MLKRILGFGLVIVLVVGVVGGVSWAVPNKIAFSGKIDPKPTNNLRFEIGTWSETWTVSDLNIDENGVFSVLLGSKTPIDPAIFTGAELDLNVTVDGTLLTPPQKIVSVPYAFRAAVADSAAAAGGWETDGSTKTTTDFNVGIGTTSPNELLEIRGNNTAGELSLSNSDRGIYEGDTLGTLYFRNYDATSGVAGNCAAIEGVAGYDFTGANATELVFKTSFQAVAGQTLVERMRIDKRGNVGIGTPDPNQTLDVRGNTYIEGNLGIGATIPVEKLEINDGALKISRQGDGAVLLDLNTERNWQFKQKGTGATTALELENIGGGGNKRFNIKTFGTVGLDQAELELKRSAPQIHFIDDVAPAGAEQNDYWLHVNSGKLYFIWDEDDNGSWGIEDAAGNIVGWESPYPMTIHGRNVGINTSSPQQPLQVGDTGTKNYEGMIRVAHRDIDGGTNQARAWDFGTGDTVFGHNDNFGFRDVTGNKVMMVMENVSGNVGIGTTDPQSKLDISAAGNGVELLRLSTERPWVFRQMESAAVARLDLHSTVAYKDFTITSNNDEIVARFYAAEGDGHRVYLVEDGGRVGIGTKSPDANLEVIGDAKIGDKSDYTSGGQSRKVSNMKTLVLEGTSGSTNRTVYFPSSITGLNGNEEIYSMTALIRIVSGSAVFWQDKTTIVGSAPSTLFYGPNTITPGQIRVQHDGTTGGKLVRVFVVYSD